MKWLIPAALAIGLGVFVARRANAALPDPTYYAEDQASPPDVIDQVQATAYDWMETVMGSPVDYLTTSDAMRSRLKQREGLRLTRYRLGDGGWTIGYGRFYPDSGPPPPEQVDRNTAELWFLDDLDQRAEKWVKAYVSIPLTQNQFDALVSMAYNLRPSSFKRIADAVNAGGDPAPIALQYTRPGTNLEAGLIARREEELGIFFGTIEA